MNTFRESRRELQALAGDDRLSDLARTYEADGEVHLWTAPVETAIAGPEVELGPGGEDVLVYLEDATRRAAYAVGGDDLDRAASEVLTDLRARFASSR